MDKPTELKTLSEKEADEVHSKSKDSGSMLDDLSDLAKTKRALPQLPAGGENEHVRKLYADYKDKVIGDNEATDQQISILQGIADRLLDDKSK